MFHDVDCAFAVFFWFLQHQTNSVACQCSARIDANKHLKSDFLVRTGINHHHQAVVTYRSRSPKKGNLLFQTLNS